MEHKIFLVMPIWEAFSVPRRVGYGIGRGGVTEIWWDLILLLSNVVFLGTCDKSFLLSAGSSAVGNVREEQGTWL